MKKRLIEVLKDAVRILFSGVAAALCLWIMGAGFCPFLSIAIGVAHWATLLGTARLFKRHYGIAKDSCPTAQVQQYIMVGFVFSSFLLALLSSPHLGFDFLHAVGFAGMFAVLGVVLALASNLITRRFPAADVSAAN